jgi:hypothetical protein
MLGSELAYVREKLSRTTAAERKEIAKSLGMSGKTLSRLASKETKYGRTDTVGKLALHFRTRDRRG